MGFSVLPTFLATPRLKRNSKHHAMEQQTIEGTWEETLQCLHLSGAERGE
ncbi:hypothetical protein [Microcystis aeruginosa]|uniref:Uncharacterized protein n=1 Tax=Microcystis aeruginosa FD4 TaxID=2686288 RepID=A0A857CY57_MICAE|nr:hypothetical protein [Microcystis aeruginosa]QGZ88326.1 hypothetical protein GQR42_00475 [Microcystis aeruginosa FD4]